MPIRSMAPTYTSTAKVLHWFIVALLVVQYGTGWLMPRFGAGISPGGLIGIHLAFGFVILCIMALRLLWRLFNPVPPAPEGNIPFMKEIGTLTHWALYFFAILTPLSGWAYASSFGWQVSLFGYLVPSLPTSSLVASLGHLHPAIAAILVFLIGLHVAAAFFHQFILRDNLFTRMWFTR